METTRVSGFAVEWQRARTMLQRADLYVLPAAETLNRASRFAVAILIARAIGVEAFGEWLIAAAMGLILTAGGDAGFGVVLTARMAANRALTRSYLAGLLGLVPVLCTVVLGALGLIALTFFPGSYALVLLLLGTGGMLECMAFLILSPLRAEGRPVAEGSIRAIQGPTLLGATVLLLALGIHNVQAFAALFAGVGVASLAVATIMVVVRYGLVRPRLHHVGLLDAVPQAAPAAMAVLIWLVYFRVDAFLIAYVRGAAETGVYGAAYNVAFGLAFVPVMLGRGLLPRLASASSGSELRRSFYGGMRQGVLAGACVTLALGAALPVVGIVYGSEFSGVHVPYMLLVVAQGLYFVSHLNQVLLLARGHTSLVWLMTAGMLSVRVALNLLLLPGLGAAGAGIAAVICEATLICIQLAVIRRVLAEVVPRPELEAPVTTVKQAA
jgi:O-antigen/teichoic acid export membrane protein